ncbi:MAG: hypothetical protein IKL97_01560 [Eggerthellaceae bacterium]|nr:hypothetical protein [Eggerthellaceae bacterium]
MTIKDLLIEGIWFGGDVFVASASDAKPHWSGKLHPDVESNLREEDGALPDWFARMEVAAIGAAEDGSLLVAVR